jgi:hypothetical protein
VKVDHGGNGSGWLAALRRTTSGTSSLRTTLTDQKNRAVGQTLDTDLPE